MSTSNGRPVEALRGAAMLPPVAPAPAPTPKPPRTSHGRFAEINGFIDYTLANLTPSAVAVWLILWRDTKPNGLARTGQADLARRAGVTERAVRNALTVLCAAKLVKVVRRGRVGAGPSTYRVRGVNPDGKEVTGTHVPVVGGTEVPNFQERPFRHPIRDHKRRPASAVAAKTTDIEQSSAGCDN